MHLAHSDIPQQGDDDTDWHIRGAVFVDDVV